MASWRCLSAAALFILVVGCRCSGYDDDFEEIDYFDENVPIYRWWVGAQKMYEGNPVAEAYSQKRLDELESSGILDKQVNTTLVKQCKVVADNSSAEQMDCPIGLIRPEQCCGDEGYRCKHRRIKFTNPHVSDLWPKVEVECPLQQICSRCMFTAPSGRGKMFRIVQANDPNYLPVTCSKACDEGCAVILWRYALVAHAMRFVSYAWEWALLGVMLAAALVALLLLRRSNLDVVVEGHKILSLLAIAVVTFGGGMIMLAAAGAQGTTGEATVTRVMGGNWQPIVYITGAFQTSAATLVTLMTAADLAVSHMLNKAAAKRVTARRTRRTRSGASRPLLATATLRFEALGTCSVGCLVTIVLVLITPAKFDYNQSECLVYANVPEINQWYEGNKQVWEQDSIATDQMVSIWLTTAYTVSVFLCVWSITVFCGIVRKTLSGACRGSESLCSVFCGSSRKTFLADASVPSSVTSQPADVDSCSPSKASSTGSPSKQDLQNGQQQQGGH